MKTACNLHTDDLKYAKNFGWELEYGIFVPFPELKGMKEENALNLVEKLKQKLVEGFNAQGR